MEDFRLKIEYININELKPYSKNAKKHPKKQIKLIKNSIESFGMCDPIAINNEKIIIEGHGRLEALKQLGYDEVPCIRLDHLTDEERKAYTLAHNKVMLKPLPKLWQIVIATVKKQGLKAKQFKKLLTNT